MAYGNEPRGNSYESFLAEFVRYWQAKGDNRRLYTTGSGWPVIDSICDFNNTPRPRLQGTAQKAEINKNRPSSTYNWDEIVIAWNKPTISHEIGQWCAYPDFTEIDKYTGVLKAGNYEIFRDRLKEKGMEHLAEDFKMASGKLQLLCYKAEIEAALRTKELAGFQLLDLRDFPGQGTAPVGVLNTLWEEKGCATAKDYSHFCNDLVPLALFPKMIYENDEMLDVKIEVSNFAKVTPKEVATWQITTSNGDIFASGELAIVSDYGSCIPLGYVKTTLTAVTPPMELTLTVRVGEYENFWNFYVFPTLENISAGDVVICDHMSDKVIEALNQGAKVLLTLRKGTLKEEAGGDIRFGFSPIFWNTVWVNKDVPYTLGILCDPKHPALAEFPTSYHSNWQWWDASTHAQPINMEYVDKNIIPFARAIDRWAEARSLGLMFEGKVGKGSILVCAIDLLTNQETRPEARALINSLLSYMNTDKFNPKESLDVFRLKQLQNK